MENGMSAIDKLLDKNNNDNLILYNTKGEAIEFEQIAVIPMDHKIYALLAAAVPNEDMDEDEGIVFSIEKAEDGKESLRLVTDEAIIEKIFEMYESLLDELELEDLDEEDESKDEKTEAESTGAEEIVIIADEDDNAETKEGEE